MGVVYKAQHLALKRTVALKMVLAGGHAGPEELARFRIEAEAVARLQHPNIVQIHEVGEADGHPYCALEFVEGGNLAGKLDGKPMPVVEAAQLVETLARAMHVAHCRNVVHRDLKPANILLTADGTPKITDFGLARRLDSDAAETQTGAVLGTPAYMAPEQAAGNARDAGPAADVYALGAILYACLAGRPPFKAKSVVETLDQVRGEEPAPPSRWHASIPADLEAVCLKCLEKNPAHRYASAEELANDLARFRMGDATKARPWSWRRRLARGIRKHWKPIAAASFVFVTALAFLFTFVWTSPEYQARQALNRVDAAMKSGERVELIGLKGPPQWSRQVFDAVDSRLSTDKASVFQIDANSHALLELSPAAHHDRYRFSAEVRMVSSKISNSSAGVYFAHNAEPADPSGVVERVFVVMFNRNRLIFDRPKDAVNVQDCLLLSRDGATKLAMPTPVGVHFYTIDTTSMEEPWRYFEVEVTPETVRAGWRELDGTLHLIGVRNEVKKTVNPIRTEHLKRISPSRIKFLDKNYPEDVRRIEYNPRGALGLYVSSGVAEFRNVVYEPLAEN
jgi:serine/threonine protein kinase